MTVTWTPPKLLRLCLILMLGIGIGGLCLITGGRTAEAALFCVTTPSNGSECLYDDAASCRQRARDLGGMCTANQDELLANVAVGDYPVCLVLSPTTVQCLYQEFGTCNRDALHSDAACVNLSALQVLGETPTGVINTQNIRK